MIEYILVLVDQPSKARELNGLFHAIDMPTLKLQAFSFGQQMHGLQFRGTRPTRLIDLMTDEVRKEDRYDKWYKYCVEPNKNGLRV